MKRTCLLIGWIGAGLFSAPRAVAQDDDVQVWLLGLFAMAHFPLLKEVDNMRHPTGPTEYRLFSYWVMDKWGDRSPENFDLVAIIENKGAVPIGPITLHLSRDRKIGGTWDFEYQPPPAELAQWEGPISIETRTVGALDGNSITSVWFGPFPADELVVPLWREGLWSWVAKYEVTLQCTGCSSATLSESFNISHAN